MEPQPNSMQTVESKIPLQERDESPGRVRCARAVVTQTTAVIPIPLKYTTKISTTLA